MILDKEKAIPVNVVPEMFSKIPPGSYFIKINNQPGYEGSELLTKKDGTPWIFQKTSVVFLHSAKPINTVSVLCGELTHTDENDLVIPFSLSC